MEELKGGYRFKCSGRQFQANGYIGIRPDLEIAEGYDGRIEFYDDEGDFVELTKEEKKELSEYMINLWKAFAEK